MSLNKWIDAVSRLVSKLMSNFEASYGYPPGENVLLVAARECGTEAVQALSSVGAPRELLDFYSRVREVLLPDVGNGLFVHSAEAVVTGITSGQPTEVVGAVEDVIMVFGSDGGGGLFALNRTGDKVYRLSGGSLIGPSYEVDDAGVRVVSHGFWKFLEYVHQELSKAVSAA